MKTDGSSGNASTHSTGGSWSLGFMVANDDLTDMSASRLSMSDFFASCASLQQQTCHSEANHFNVGSDGVRIPMFAAKERMQESFAESGEVDVKNAHMLAEK
jgi:hypothetical protein